MGRRLQSLASALTGAVAAAGVVYSLDASSGRQRRAQLADRPAGAARRGLLRLQAASRGLLHRAYGLSARLRGTGQAASGVAERVRTRIGRVLSHPGAVQVSADAQHIVRLSGAVLAWEHEPLRRAVAAVPGVRAIRDELRVYESAEQASALQAEPGAPPTEASATGSGGSAALRVLMALAAGSLRPGGSRRRGAQGAVAAAAGGALLLRSVALPRSRTRRSARHTLEVCQTLHVRAPAQSVFAALRQIDRLVAPLPALRVLRHRADGATQWMARDSSGWRLDWTAVITELQPNRQIAWRTTADSSLTQWGMVWLDPIDAQQTQVHLYASLRSMPGRSGQLLRQLLGAGADGELNANLERLRRYLETAAGSAAGTAASPPAASAGADLFGAWTQPIGGRTHCGSGWSGG